MSIIGIISEQDFSTCIVDIMSRLHVSGPVSGDVLEEISYLKKFNPEKFSLAEEKVIAALGLFYKIPEQSSVYSFLMAGFGRRYKNEYGDYLTPVQASVRRAVDENRIVSISAPTSAGKSYSIREFIANASGDAVIVVPSRALIAEYINSIKRRFRDDKSVMILAFVDEVFKSRNPRRIFVLTPERARDLFSKESSLDIKTFFFDEAQVSEEGERGIVFDVLVRRAKRRYPSASMIFAHPFVENPEAQLKKHGFSEGDSFSRSYPHGAVGKIFVYQHGNGGCYYFSPYSDKGWLLKKCIKFEGGFDEFAFDGSHSVLVYVSKKSIYDGRYLDSFEKYIKQFDVIDSPEALKIIETIGRIVGADAGLHKSSMVELLRKGVVIHHGSVPLEVRFLVEELIRMGFAKICFATSTLAQGVNMPFDIVWLDNMRVLGDTEQSKSLAFKNLIGRAGRLSDRPVYDYGYVFTKNPELLSNRFNGSVVLNEKSIIDQSVEGKNQDFLELIEAVRTDTFDDDKQMPLSRVQRLSDFEVLDCCRTIVEMVYRRESIAESLSGGENKQTRENLRHCFRIIFERSINRGLKVGELSVFREAISIFLQVIQGRSFREIVGTRYSWISNRDGDRVGHARFSQAAAKLPDSSLEYAYSVFDSETLARSASYDAVVFDTYDYIDQVISFSLVDTFVAAFKIYRERIGDERADDMVQLLRFGTNNQTYSLLMRYGFPSDRVSELADYVESVSERDLVFNEKIRTAPKDIQDMVSWYLP